MTRILTASAAALAAALAAMTIPTAARAQYVGPSTVPAVTVQALKDTGKDDQQAVLRGKILGSTGHDRYKFADGTGEMTVKIKPALWPAGQKVSETTTVELVGEYDKELIGESHFDVKAIRLP